MSEVCSRLGISQSTATNHLRLLTLPVATQLAVHEGKLSYVKALRDASERGEGSTTGPRSGVPVKAMRRALSQIDKRPLSLPADHGADERLYTQAEVSELLAASLALATGVHVDELPESLREVATSPTVRPTSHCAMPERNRAAGPVRDVRPPTQWGSASRAPGQLDHAFESFWRSISSAQIGLLNSMAKVCLYSSFCGSLAGTDAIIALARSVTPPRNSAWVRM